MAPPAMERKIAQLVEMGASRAAAKSALSSCKGDVEEAAMVVFEDKHARALDVDSDDDDNGAAQAGSSASGLNGRARTTIIKMPTPDDDEEEEQEPQDDAYDDEDEAMDDYHEGFDEGDHDDDVASQASADNGDGDAYGFLQINRDRKETITEVEEPVKTVWISLKERGEWSTDETVPRAPVQAQLFGLQRWLSGCPEGNEQQQLFPLYNTLAGDSFSPSLCPNGCQTSVKHYESDFFSVINKFEDYLKRAATISRVACSTCKKGICLACGGTCALPDAKGKQKAVEGSKEDEDNVLFHCPEMQAIIIGVGLYAAEKLWDENTTSSAKATVNPKKRKGTPSEQDAAQPVTAAHPIAGIASRHGQNYHKAGVGYGGSSGAGEDYSGQVSALKQQQKRDQDLASLLALVRQFLPNRERGGPFRASDHMPAGQTLAHLRRRFNPMASHLLSAESLSDMSERTELYTEFMAWLETMSAHENLAGLMGQPIKKPASITYTTSHSDTSSASSRREKVIVFEANPGPRELLEKILSQVKVAKRVSDAAKAREEATIKAAENASKPADGRTTASPSPYVSSGTGQLSAESKRLVEFCDTIVKAVGKIDKALRQSKKGEAVLKAMGVHPSLPSSARSGEVGASTPNISDAKQENISNLPEEELKKRYETWAKEIGYGHYDWEMPPTEDQGDDLLGPSYKHYYSKEARRVTSYPARNTALMKEHTMLSSSLPASWGSSVFLKIDESRPDVMKALIVGPDNTPYENGCFLFDILLGGNYNQGPPVVKSMTTKGGKYRLNPNLYAEGKVCLSLLGTWSGPGWVAGKSTLLQVLISIQAMILCSEPIANEPGFEKDIGGARSTAYNANVRRMVVHIAMLDYLKTEAPEGFQEIIDMHFRLKARSIKAQLDKWVSEDDKSLLAGDSMNSIHGYRTHAAPAPSAGSSQSQFEKEVGEVKALLDKLEKGESIRQTKT